MEFRNARVQRIWNRWIAVGVVVGCAVLAYGIARDGHLLVVLFLAILAGGLAQTFGFRAHVHVVLRRGWTMLGDAFEREDARRARVAIETMRGVASAEGAAVLVLHEAGVFALEERWAEAIEKLDTFDLVAPERYRVYATNVRACCYAESGRGREAVDLAKGNLETARAQKLDDLAPYVATLGAAHHFAGDQEAAIKALQAALDMGGRPRAIAIRYYHLGEAARALGRTEQARGAYRRAAEAQPRGRWGERARERLRAMESEPYRK